MTNQQGDVPPSTRRRWPFAALLVAQGVSVTGNRVALLAIPWFVLQTTDSPGRTGLVAAANTLPALVAGVFAGPLIDRLGLRRTSVLADVASGTTIAAIPILHALGALAFWPLVALVFLGALLDAPGDTARRALLPDVAAVAGTSIDRAASWHESTYRATQLLGGPLAGVLIATVGAQQALLVDAVTFGVSAILIATIRGHAAPVPDRGVKYGAQIWEAVEFIRRHPLLPSFILVFVVANVLEQGLVAVLMPVYAERVLDSPIALGLMVGAAGMGVMLGVVAYGFMADRVARRSVLALALLLAGAPKYLLLAGFPGPVVAVAGIALLSVAMGPVNPISAAVEYEAIPRALRGRVLGLMSTAYLGTSSLGVLGAGMVAETVELRLAFMIGAALYASVALVPLLHPAWRHVDDPGLRSATEST